MTKSIIPHETPIQQVQWVLKDIEDSVPLLASGADRRIERLCSALTSALADLDDRLTALEQYDANRVYVARLDAELAESQKFTDLASLVNARCTCGREYEVIPVAGSHFARCVSPACEGHGKLISVSRQLAQAWESLAQGEDMAYAEAEEEASNG